jgi:hypothetical protein
LDRMSNSAGKQAMKKTVSRPGLIQLLQINAP